MQILIIGFQRSGTTLMRRLFGVHPEVKKMVHEAFLLKKCSTKDQLIQLITSAGVSPFKDNWGEKTPFYPNIRGIPVDVYCKRWNRYFGKTSRILHIVRHPVDVVNSIVVKSRGRQHLEKALGIYQRRMTTIIPKLSNIKNVHTFKYEDLLIRPDDIVPELYKFCRLTSDVDFRQLMSGIKNKKYKNFDKTRAFAHTRGPIKIRTDLSSVLTVINKNVGGVKYNIK